MVDVKEDGSILLNMDYFDFATKLTMTNDRKWKSLLGVSRREPESEIGEEHMNLALAIQQITEQIVVALARTARELTGCKNLVMAGGVALNCVANSKIAALGLFENIWIQPAAGDAGGALGAAFAVHHIFLGKAKGKPASFDGMKYAYLGPQFSDLEIGRVVNLFDAPFEYIQDPAELTFLVSQKIADGKIVGWFQGRMEFGPRALGNRSILADPRNPEIQKTLNLKIKYREGFRPFAPQCFAGRSSGIFFFRQAISLYAIYFPRLNKNFRILNLKIMLLLESMIVYIISGPMFRQSPMWIILHVFKPSALIQIRCSGN